MTKMKLSKNLSLAETIRSATAMRHGIENNPTPEHIVNLMSIAENIFQPVRDYLGRALFVSSGYRSAELNSLINGSKTSQHLVGSALDLDNGDDNYTVFHYIKDNLDFDQLIWEFGAEPKWLHVSYVSEKENRKRVLVTKRRGKYYTWADCKDC